MIETVQFELIYADGTTTLASASATSRFTTSLRGTLTADVPIARKGQILRCYVRSGAERMGPFHWPGPMKLRKGDVVEATLNWRMVES